ncbi:DUF3592 domain-containing protein [Brachybacterium sp. FME24]|uniref:DUF3592 domain-containing protein n=1 Tax=Brachybacterium sp. FME24 TaxID=2742605 RepID=UPI001866975D|nr:DUF3592 domain-containing protein [Brachybacterium sp. FME24]
MDLFTVVFGILVVLSLVLAGWWALRGLRERNGPPRLLQGPTAVGRVVASEPSISRGEDGTVLGTDYTETVEFTDGQGRTQRAKPTWQETTTTSRRGQSVTVHYDRDRPSTFIAPQVPGSFTTRGARTTFLIAGSFALATVVLVVVALVIR